MKNVAAATRKMIGFYYGNRHDIAHFLKVWAMAKTIGELEGLDGHTQEVLELAAVVHDIACPLCREKYGDTNGKHQELESLPCVVGVGRTETHALPDLQAYADAVEKQGHLFPVLAVDVRQRDDVVLLIDVLLSQLEADLM